MGAVSINICGWWCYSVQETMHMRSHAPLLLRDSADGSWTVTEPAYCCRRTCIYQGFPHEGFPVAPQLAPGPVG